MGAGGNGGTGGEGGQGGHGGGGGGGPSIGIVEDAASSSTRDGNTFYLGDPGLGGPPADEGGANPGNPGANGEGVEYKKLDAG